MQINNHEFMQSLADILQELKSQLVANHIDLLDTIRESGDNIQCTCPFHADGHERRPSFGIRKDTGIGHCFTCDTVVELPELISYCFGRNDKGAFGWQWLLQNFLSVESESRNVQLNIGRNNNGSNISDIPVSYVSEDELDSYRWTCNYWTKRGIIDESIIELFDLGYSKSERMITFPVRDIQGKCLFVAKRSIDSKYFHYPAGVQKPLYGLYELSQHWVEYEIEEHIEDGTIGANKHKAVYVCESMIDCILLWQAGYYAVALNGLGNKLALQQLQDLPCRTLVLATDMDEAGQKARQRIKSIIKNKLIMEVFLPEGRKDIGECTAEEIRQLEPVLVRGR